jgi:hypothetical protein
VWHKEHSSFSLENLLKKPSSKKYLGLAVKLRPTHKKYFFHFQRSVRFDCFAFLLLIAFFVYSIYISPFGLGSSRKTKEQKKQSFF